MKAPAMRKDFLLSALNIPTFNFIGSPQVPVLKEKILFSNTQAGYRHWMPLCGWKSRSLKFITVLHD